MQLTLAGLDALRILRALRCQGVDVSRLPRADLQVPDPSPYQRFRANHFDLDALLLGASPTPERPLRVCVPSRSVKLRASFFRCAIVAQENVPTGSFLELGSGLQIPCPELVFLQVTDSMLPVIQLALGFELCGGFSRNPNNPIQESSRLGVEPVTTAERVVAYLDTCRNLPGLVEARYLARYLCDNAWSPMEAASAALFSLPFDELGYDLAPLTLNRRLENASNMPGHKASRVPDIMFTGTHIGLNYDGAEHLDLDGIAAAAQNTVRNTDSPSSNHSLQSAIKQVRDKYVDDHRRDRELLSQGLIVLPITIEDIREPGGLDAIAAWVIEQMEKEGSRDLSLQKSTLKSPALARARQQVVWSLLPGRRGRAARRRLVEHPFMTSNPRTAFEGMLEW